MVREIMKDEAFLAEASEKATAEDADTARDLLETLEAHTHNPYCKSLHRSKTNEYNTIPIIISPPRAS